MKEKISEHRRREGKEGKVKRSERVELASVQYKMR